MTDRWSEELLSPDWVVIGLRLAPDRVRLMASTSMTKAQLQGVAERHLPPASALLRPATMDVRYELAAVLTSFVIVDAGSYAEAMIRLASKWDAEAAASKNLGDYQQRALTW